jgi:hypothetical protein
VHDGIRQGNRLAGLAKAEESSSEFLKADAELLRRLEVGNLGKSDTAKPFTTAKKVPPSFSMPTLSCSEGSKLGKSDRPHIASIFTVALIAILAVNDYLSRRE